MNILSFIWMAVSVIFSMTLCLSSAQAYTCNTTTLTTTLTIPNMTIPRDAPTGTKIGGSVSTGTIDSYSCTNEAPSITYQEFGAKGLGVASSRISGRNVYLLGNSGVGYTVGLNYRSACASSTIFYIDGTYNGDGNVNNFVGCAGNSMLGSQPMRIAISLDFYKVGNLRPGKIAAQNVASAISRVNRNVWLNPESIVRSTEFTLTSQGCSVTNTSITVPMGTVNSSHFTGVGSTTGDQSFSIPLSCDAGIKVGLTVTGGGSGNWNADSGLINLDSSSSTTVANGVKLQILSQGTPIKLGSLLNVGIQAAKGTLNIPLTARYYQSATPITAGQANGTATFTMTYQ